ncbi:hypothetical protein M1307_02665, partial [Patescibacteria group bacterium]|nr:hypothetical protein [Patescibacteria group bacterium]
VFLGGDLSFEGLVNGMRTREKDAEKPLIYLSKITFKLLSKPLLKTRKSIWMLRFPLATPRFDT